MNLNTDKNIFGNYESFLENSRFRAGDKGSFFINKQIYHLIKKNNKGSIEDNSLKEKLKKLSEFVNEKFTQIDSSHSFCKNYFLDKINNIRLIKPEFIIKEDGILYIKINELFNKQIADDTIKEFKSMDIIKLPSSISDDVVIKNLFIKKFDFKVDNVRNYDKKNPKKEVSHTRKRHIELSLHRELRIISLYKVNLVINKITAKIKNESIIFIPLSQIFLFLEKEFKDENNLNRLVESFHDFLNNHREKFTLVRDNKQIFKNIFFKNANLFSKFNPYFFNISDKTDSFYKKIIGKLNELFDEKNINIAIEKINKLPIDKDFSLSEEETLMILQNVDPQNPLLTQYKVKEKPRNLNAKRALDKYLPKEKFLKKQKSISFLPSKKEIDVRQTTFTPTLDCIIFSNNLGKSLSLSHNRGIFNVKITGNNFTDNVKIQYGKKNEIIDWNFVDYSKEKSTPSCLQGIRIDSSIIFPGNYTLKVTGENNETSNMDFEVI